MARGAQRVFEDAELHLVPLADGGEGTLEALLSNGGTRHVMRVRSPLGELIDASWGVLPDGRGVIEMSQASGLTLVPENMRDAMAASSFGTGELVKAALDFGCRELLIGIGGSASTDGGIGLLSALGARFLDASGKVLLCGGELGKLQKIELEKLDPRLKNTSITVLSDVTNPLLGAAGAASVYAPQKGASQSEVIALDAGLHRLAQLSQQFTAHDFAAFSGAGAAGGVGFAFLAFCGARMRSGIEIVLETVDFAEKLEKATLVLTGEGALDLQSLSGKTIAGVCKAAQAESTPVIAFGGKVTLSGTEMDRLGLLSAFPIADAPLMLEECMNRGAELLENAVERALRVVVVPGARGAR